MYIHYVTIIVYYIYRFISVPCSMLHRETNIRWPRYTWLDACVLPDDSLTSVPFKMLMAGHGNRYLAV